MFGPPKNLFRKAALDKLSSPEQLDVMMQVTSPAGWLALTTLAALLLLAVVWSVVGEIAIRVDGQGLLIQGGAVQSVPSNATGRVSEVMVKMGDEVQPNQVIAKLRQPDLELRIQNTRAELAALSAQGAGQSQGTRSVIAQYEAQARSLREKIRTQTDMAARGLITRNTLLRTQEQLANTEALIVQARASETTRGNSVEAVRRTLVELESQLANSTTVTSPFGGRVIELMAAPGDLVEAGQRLLSLEQVNQPLRVVLYIPAGEGKKVEPPMEVRVSPSTVKVEEYGFMIAKVQKVSPFPMTPDGLQRVLRNESLVQTLLEKGAPIEIVADLVPASTESGYQWSSSTGPPHRVQSGTLCTASVVVERRPPISYVLPILRQTFGAS